MMPSDHSNPDHRPGLGALKVPAGMSYTQTMLIANSYHLLSAHYRGPRSHLP